MVQQTYDLWQQADRMLTLEELLAILGSQPGQQDEQDQQDEQGQPVSGV